MTMIFPSFQLLELNIISAQDLAPISRKMKTYAVAWVHPERKLTTRVDYNGGANPTWNDKFVFRVNEEFLYADTSAVEIEIYALHWFRDVHVGTVRVLISNLIPPNRRPGYRTSNNEYRRTPPQGMRFVALQVRRTSGRPQGILNIGVGLLDGSMRSMPLYTHMDSSAVGYRDLLGEEDPHLQHLNLNSTKGSSKNPNSPRNPQSPSSNKYQSVISKPELRRTKSDSSSMVVSDLLSRAERSRLAKRPPASAVASSESETVPTTTDSDEKISEEYSPPSKNPRKRYDSIESDLTDPSPMENPHVVMPRRERDEVPYHNSYHQSRNTPRRERDEVPHHNSYHQSRTTPRRTTMHDNQRSMKAHDHGQASPYLSRHGTPLRSNIISSTPMRSNGIGSTPMRSKIIANSPMRHNMVETTPMRTPLRSNMIKSTPIRSNYKASEVAEKIAKDRSQETESSILSEWSYDESNIEGLRSKLERWRTELPPLYDIGSNYTSSTDYNGAIVPASGGMKKTPAKKKHNRRHTDSGPFSCFSKICGVECSFVCGGGRPMSPTESNKGRPERVRRTYSADDLSSM